MRTLKWLIEHIKKHDDMVIIIGPGASTNEIKAVNKDIYNRKTLKRESKKFWEYYKENVDRDIDEKSLAYKLAQQFKEDGYASYILNQTIDSSVSGDNLVGHVDLFKCERCDITFHKKSIDFEKDDLNTCEICGCKIRPSVLVCGEKYPQNVIDNLVDSINATHTLFLIGVDLSDPVVENYISQYGQLRQLFNDANREANNEKEDEKDKKHKVIVSVQDLDSLDTNQVAFCDFKVEGEVQDSLARFIKGWATNN